MQRLKEIQVDTTGFHVVYWGQKTFDEFKAEATKEGAGMIPEEIDPRDREEWLKIAHEQIVKAYNGDETVMPTMKFDEIKEAAAAASTAKETTDAVAEKKPAANKKPGNASEEVKA